MPARLEIVEYRLKYLGLGAFGQEIVGEMDALTRLFMFCLEKWPEKHPALMPAGIGRDLDDFTGIINDFFGYGSELVDLAVERFRV